MNDDPILSRLRDLPSPTLDEPTRARVRRRAERVLDGERHSWRAWSGWALAAVLLACETVYVVEVIAKVRVLFG
jgi:hypothetical protein